MPSVLGGKAIKKIFFIFLVLTLGWAASTQAAVYYVRGNSPGGCTTANPTACNWDNAYPSLPATLERGATYYIAGFNGSYPAYTFNTPASGTQFVTIKKARAGDPVVESVAGWVSSYGTLQAVFSSYFNIAKSSVVVDGGYRDEYDWFNGTKYGFKIQHTNNWQHMRIMDPSLQVMSNVTVKYIYIAAIVGSLPSGCNNHCTQTYGPCAINTNNETATPTSPAVHAKDYVFSHLYVEGSNNPYFMRYLDDPTLEYSASEKTSGSDCWHGDTVNLYYSNHGSGIVANNHFRDQYNGTGGGSQGSTGVIVFSESTGGKVYGNIFERVNVGNGVIAADWPNSNLKIHHNTFVGSTPYSDRPVISFPTGGNTGTGNEAYNNLRYNTVQINFVGGAGTGADNATETSDAFNANLSQGLKRATNIRGRSLPSPYNKYIDHNGNEVTRGSDGYIDTGAFEFGGTAPTFVHHPADTTPQDKKISLNEATSFGACWKSNCSLDATLNNAVRAGTLWNASADGEYSYNVNLNCPACWVIVP